MTVIKMKDINLIYSIPSVKKIKDIIFSLKSINNNLIGNDRIHALKDITVTLKEGDRLGLIGPNGAGKTSFLKLVAGIYPPERGELFVKGNIACLFELATGFEMEASGWDNIYLRGIMLGEHPAELKKKLPSIAEFSELGDYLNIPVKYYSSGMFLRLAFSISTAINADILLLDEVVAAGDAAFIEKARKRLQELMDRVKILIFATHDMGSLKNFCDKCIWLENGEIKMFGSSEEVSQSYIEAIQNRGT